MHLSFFSEKLHQVDTSEMAGNPKPRLKCTKRAQPVSRTSVRALASDDQHCVCFAAPGYRMGTSLPNASCLYPRRWRGTPWALSLGVRSVNQNMTNCPTERQLLFNVVVLTALSSPDGDAATRCLVYTGYVFSGGLRSISSV